MMQIVDRPNTTPIGQDKKNFDLQRPAFSV